MSRLRTWLCLTLALVAVALITPALSQTTPTPKSGGVLNMMLREDLPQELLPTLAKRRKDKEYLWINRPDWMDFTPIQNLLEELRKGK